MKPKLGCILDGMPEELLSNSRKQALLKRCDLVSRAVEVSERILNQEEQALKKRIRAVRSKEIQFYS